VTRVKKGLETKRRGRGRGTYESGRPPVVTMVERFTGRVKFIVAESLSISVINGLVINHVDGPVIVYTDEYKVYNGLSELSIVVDHRRVNYSEGVFADGDAHINTAEGIHSRPRIFFGFIAAQIGEIRSFTCLSSPFTITVAQNGLRILCGLVSTSINWRKIYVRQIHDIYMATIKKGRALLFYLTKCKAFLWLE